MFGSLFIFDLCGYQVIKILSEKR